MLGGEYSRTTYADLWAWVQTQTGYLINDTAWGILSNSQNGNVPFYSSGDGSTTFRVPSLKCWIKGPDGTETVGTYLEAGLPNIEGQLGLWGTEKRYSTTSGAFSTNNGEMYYGAGHTPDGGLIADFNASHSNSIYGKSSTVQPESIVGMWVVKAYGTVTNVGSTDVSAIAQGLTEAETRIGQLENHGAGATVVESYRNGTEWYRVWSDGWLEQGGSDLTSSDNGTKNFLLPFADTNYTALISINSRAFNGFCAIYKASVSYFTYRAVDLNGSQNSNCKAGWYACGMGA